MSTTDTTPARATSAKGEPLIEVTDLHTRFSLRGSFVDRLRGREAGAVKAVDGVSFTLGREEVLGVVGESGSGKTTLGRTLLGLVRPSEGSIRIEGQEVGGLSETEWRPLRRRLQVVQQDPHASLNPAMTIGDSVADPLRFHGLEGDRETLRRLAAEALERVGLQPAENFMDSYPTDLSGGQKQRAVLARAVILRPDVLIADEPVSMLDMSVRAKILELMLDLKDEYGLTYLYITHDLATAKFFCDRIAIMYLGKIVELGPAEEIYADPKHPYTKALLDAIPEPDPRRAVPRDLPRGEVPDAVVPPLGCPFHPRCPRAFEVCGWESRDLRAQLESHWTKLPEEHYEEEREVIGGIEGLDEATIEARLEAGSGYIGDDVQGVLDELRRDHPEDPFWKGVREIEAGGREVAVRFNEPLEPREVEVGRSRVLCHLHDPAALERARELSQTQR